MKDGFVWCPHCRQPHLLTERVCAQTGRWIDPKLHRLTAVRHPLVGMKLGDKYEILEPIARGGVGVIFEAEDHGLHRRVAIKVVTDARGREAARRLEREAVLIAGINHPNVCVVFDIGRLPDGLPYVVMERLHGETLSERLRRSGAIELPYVVDMMIQVLHGLEAAHNARVIHRDLKPSNLFMVDRGPKRPALIKLLDFGYAKDLSTLRPASTLTTPGSVVGTPRYMAPEVLRGQPGSVASDIFACGVVLFEALTGQHPFGGATPLESADAILSGRAQNLRQVAQQPISSAIESVVVKALSRKTENRFTQAREMRRALSAAAKVRFHPGDSQKIRAMLNQLREDSEPSSSNG